MAFFFPNEAEKKKILYNPFQFSKCSVEADFSFMKSYGAHSVQNAAWG